MAMYSKNTQPELTKEQIENFPAGRDLDALIMERVFGWKWFRVVNVAVLVPPTVAEDWLQHNSLYTPIDSPGELKREHIDGVYFISMIMPEPLFVSKDHCSDVFRLINHIAKTHWWSIKSPFEKNEMWFAGITPHSTSGWNGRPDFIGNGSTMALAVCRAALMMKFGYLAPYRTPIQ